MKINLVNNGIFPITKDKDGKLLSDLPDTGYTIAGTIQGEGALTGAPSLFIRTSGCNLRCIFRDDKGGATPCDTSYSSHYAEKNMTEIEDIISIIKHNQGNIKHVIVSGGEPTLQHEALAELLKQLQALGLHTTIETNATIFTREIAEHTNLISMSPKLRSSNPTADGVNLASSIDNKITYNAKWEAKHERDRKNIEVIQQYIDSCYKLDSLALASSGIREPNYNARKPDKSFQLKFVVSCTEDLLEIEEEFIQHLQGVELIDIMLMPEGITVDELMERGKWVVAEAIKRGWRFTPRLHTLLWGLKRST